MPRRVLLSSAILALLTPAWVFAQSPKKAPADPLDGPPIVSAKAWIVVDGTTGKSLAGTDETEPRPMASTSKIMTAWIVLRLVAADAKVLDEVVTYSDRAAKTPGSSANLKAGERVSVKELLYGLLLPSGNDAAVALAEQFGPRFGDPTEGDGLQRFVAEMNRRAKSLGLKEMAYKDPNGLSRENVSSVRDLATLAREAMKDERFRAYVATSHHVGEVIEPGGAKRTATWKNTNKLLDIDGYEGIKTGTTTPAGNCLVASAKRGENRLVVVVLGASASDGRYVDARNLFRWGWLKLGGHASAPFAPEEVRKPSTGPWDVKAIQAADVKPVWGERIGKAREVYYPGEPLAGKPTRVFAYYAKPAAGMGPFPAMVLVHGGGGKAFREWAEHWAARGYCALAMDLAGNGPKGRLEDGGPEQSDEVKFQDFMEETVRDRWTYHAVAAAIRANNLLRALPDVDKDRIAVTGISWGGYLTCIVAGLDHRFQAAVPVYGCGFLHENGAWKDARFAKMAADHRSRWVEAFDPSKYLPSVKCPILFLNGTNDFAYPLDSYKKSFALVPGPKTLSVRVRLPHGHIWTFPEVDTFIDSHLKKGESLAALGDPKRDGDLVSTIVASKVELKEAKLHYAAATGEWQTREWKSVAAVIKDGRVEAKLPADRPLVYFLAVTDKRDVTASTVHEIVSK